MLKIQEIYLGLAAILFTGILLAVPASGAEDHLKGFDANGDGRVTFEEVMRHVEPSIRTGFDALDRNHDGALSGNDFNDFHKVMQKF